MEPKSGWKGKIGAKVRLERKGWSQNKDGKVGTKARLERKGWSTVRLKRKGWNQSKAVKERLEPK